LRGAQREGLERARGADEQEEERDARERVSPEARRQSRWPGWPRLRRASPSSGTNYFPETSATAFRMLSDVMSEMPFKVFVFPVRESSTTTAGVPGTLNFLTMVLKYCMPARTSA